MRRLLKWLGILLSGIVVLLLVAAAFVWIAGGRIIDKTYEQPPSAFVADPAAADIEEGKRLALLWGCYDGCHGEGLGGQVFNDDFLFGLVVAPDLTRVFAEMSDAELDRVIRHGVRRDGRSSLVMPSASFYSLKDEHLNNLVAFVRSEPRTDGPATEISAGILARLFIYIGEFVPQAEEIARGAPWIDDEAPDSAVARGKYLAMTACSECHGMDLSGFGDFSPSLAAAIAYSDDDFRRLMREGVGLGERELGLMGEVAVKRFSVMTDEEIRALHSYLRTLVTQATTQ